MKNKKLTTEGKKGATPKKDSPTTKPPRRVYLRPQADGSFTDEDLEAFIKRLYGEGEDEAEVKDPPKKKSGAKKSGTKKSAKD
ncbi:MAG: hypothetical protein JNJ94_09265 [Chlorobi bacterium]|nr:hypothetical protein [Chlorobiota bacterium]